MIAAALRPPRNEPANSQFERPTAQERIWCLSLDGSFGSDVDINEDRSRP